MEKYAKSMMDTLLSLLAINSVQDVPMPNAPFGKGCREVLDKFCELCASFGLKTVDVDGYCGYAEVGSGELFGIPLHLDTVPFGSDWTHSPTGELALEEGKEVIYGRGAEDDKGPFIAVLYALKSLLDEGKTPKKRIRIIAGCNEESGWKCIERYKQTEEIPAMSFSPDADFPVINSEKGVCHLKVTFPCPDGVCIEGGERVNMVADRATLTLPQISDATLAKCLHGGVKIKHLENGYCLKAEGVSAHGSTPEKGDNAILKLLFAAKSSNDFVADVYDAFYQTDGSGLGIKCGDDKSGALTLNLGKAETACGKISFYLDIRYPVSAKEEDLLCAVSKALPTATLEVAGRHLPLYVSPDSVLVQSLLRAYNEVCGTSETAISIGGATYARAFPNAVAFGPVFPGEDSRIHQKDECITVDALVKCAEIYRRALELLCF